MAGDQYADGGVQPAHRPRPRRDEVVVAFRQHPQHRRVVLESNVSQSDNAER
jgi:hypothetical protein